MRTLNTFIILVCSLIIRLYFRRKTYYQSQTLLKLSFFSIILFSTIANTKAQSSSNYVTGSVNIDEKVEEMQVEKVGDNYRLCTPLDGITEEDKFTVCTIFSLNNRDELFESACDGEFTEGCGLFSENITCSWESLCTNDLDALPIGTLGTPNFIDENALCITRLGETHFFSLQSLIFTRDVLEVEPIGFAPHDLFVNVYSLGDSFGNSTINSVDKCEGEEGKKSTGVIMFQSAAQNKHYISHEWGHNMMGYLKNGGNIFTEGVHEGVPDIFADLIVLYYEVNENLTDFKETKPTYNLSGLRNWKKNHLIYRACSLIPEQTFLPEGQMEMETRSKESHFRGGIVARWFYLTSEGTNSDDIEEFENQEFQVTFMELGNNEERFDTQINCDNGTPTDPEDDTVKHACDVGGPDYFLKQTTRKFSIDGIGHWSTLKILQNALENAGSTPLTNPILMELTTQSTADLFEGEDDYCNNLRQVTESWSSINLGDKMTADIYAPKFVCGGFDFEIEAIHQIADQIRLLDDNNNEIVSASSNPFGASLRIEHLQPTETTDNFDYHFVLESTVSQVNGVSLSNPCILTQDINIRVTPVMVTPENPLVCKDETVTFSAEIHPSTTANSYSWLDSDGTEIGTSNTIDLSNTQSGTHTYSLEVELETSNGTVLTEVVEFFVTVVNSPTVNNTGDTELVFCSFGSDFSTINTLDYLNNTLKHEILDENGNFLRVFEGDGTEGILYTIEQEGTYTIRGTNGSCLPLEVEIEVSLIPIESPVVTVINEECNPGADITLMVSGNFQSFKWYEPNNPISISSESMLAGINEPIEYRVVGYDSEGCPGETIYKVAVADLGIQANPNPYEIIGMETWDISENDNIITIDGIVELTGLGRLTIDAGAKVQFIGEESGILVKRGGKLRANNVDFNVSNCSGDVVWKGLEVAGNPNVAHPDDNESFNLQHGLVALKGGSIQNAYTGISSLGGESTGGGIVDVNGVLFENNLIGIDFGATNYDNEESKVKNCNFLNSALFAGNTNGANYEHIVLRSMEIPVLIQRNTFETNTTQLSGLERGTAIRVEDSAYLIGHVSCWNLGNEFIDTYWGVDVFSMGGVQSEAGVFNNSFEGVDKGITLVGTTRDVIQQNAFELPAPDPTVATNEDVYAILTEESTAFAIEENAIHRSTQGTGSQSIEGIVVIDSNPSGEVNGATLIKNSMTGFLKVGTQFEGNNQDIDLDCNTYEDGELDWYLHWGAIIGSSDFNGELGQCIDEPNPNPNNPNTPLALRNNWSNSNNSSTAGYHVYNNSNLPLQLNVGDQFEPVTIDGVVVPNSEPCLFDVENCVPLSSQTCDLLLGLNGIIVARPIDPTHLPISVSFPELIHGKSISDPLQGQAFPGLNKLQQAFWQMMDGNCDRDCANQLLTAQNEEWSKRILVASYLNKGDFTTANNLLATLPTHDTQALQFYNIMDILLNYPLDANTESNLLSLAANQNDRYIATLAESALSIYFGHRFVRRASPVDLNGSNKKALDSNWLSSKVQLQPNPAQNQINVFLPNQLLGEQSLKMSIYDTYGNHWQTVEIPKEQLQLTVDLEALPTGMYFCRLYTHEQTLDMQKLMIVK